jgi:bifunctional pyridoxal-dependent enzyme with beta-cystathionase and maltose regulon repressor activities
MDLADLAKKAADPSARLLILCNPHNPVGRVWQEEELRELVQICLRHDILIIADEIHADLVFSSHPHLSLGSINAALANLVICTSPSKTFNLASLGNANLIIPDQDLRQKFSKEQEKAALGGSNYFGTVACQAAYEKGQDWYFALLAYLRGNIELFNDFMAQELPQLPVAELEGTYLGWIDMQALQLTWQKRQDWLASQDLYLVSGSIFGRSGEHHERINLALPRQALLYGLERLKRAVNQL